jgi:hypothetical protein
LVFPFRVFALASRCVGFTTSVQFFTLAPPRRLGALTLPSPGCIISFPHPGRVGHVRLIATSHFFALAPPHRVLHPPGRIVAFHPTACVGSITLVHLFGLACPRHVGVVMPLSPNRVVALAGTGGVRSVVRLYFVMLALPRRVGLFALALR